MKLKDLELKYAGEKLLLSGKQLRRQRELNENLKEEERYWNGQFEKLKEFGKEVLETYPNSDLWYLCFHV